MSIDPSTVVLVINVAALVWGAGKLSNTLDTLRVAVDKVEKAVKSVESLVGAHDTRITLAEHRITELEDDP